MIRCAFNGGELSPTSAVRADLDNFHRGASRIENLDLGQMGGVSRRRGFRRVAAALEGSVILPYVYSTNDRFLVEVSPALLRVLSAEGLTDKTRILDAASSGGPEIEAMRGYWAELQNHALELAGQEERVDHRSLEVQREEALSLGDTSRS